MICSGFEDIFRRSSLPKNFIQGKYGTFFNIFDSDDSPSRKSWANSENLQNSFFSSIRAFQN